MINKILKHNFGYGDYADKNFDSQIKKLQLQNVEELNLYIGELIKSQIIDAEINSNIIKTPNFPNVKLVIEKQ